MVKQINNTKNYFIHDDGYVFIQRDLNVKVIPLNIIRGVPKVRIENKKISLPMLMVEYFIEKINVDDRIIYKVLDGKVPLRHIKIKKADGLDDKDQLLIFKYKCNEKAQSQNARVKYSHLINGNDVLNSLKRTSFKCTYCNKDIKSSIWHLDHVQPLSNCGLNISQNITPACKYCNMMKGSIGLDKFIYQCNLITNNFIKESEVSNG